MSDRDQIIEVMARAEASFEEIEYVKYRELFNEQAAHVLAALDAAGLAVVPVEPTEAMLAAGMAEAGTDLASEYRAMLAASKETEG
tara:strand:- start:1748 stop:2005 length:258 start_codon:yes stop_codon:yes gene_type:complete